MKKIALSALAVLTLSSTILSASEVTPVYAKASKLKFSGLHYFGATYKDINDNKTANYEVRRNYLQVKAYLLEDPKSYLRVTLDTTYSESKDGHADIYAKYMYIYLNNVLPNSGVEFGMAHRPWIDYEEHQGWLERSISKVFAEEKEAGDLTNSADLGFNLKTKTPYFTSEMGIFNGEGYHGENDVNSDTKIGDGLSAEWRFTAATMGNGKKHRKVTKDTYVDMSFFGQYNVNSAKNSGETYTILGLHAVYNMPSFLIAGQYLQSDSDLANSSKYNGSGYSLNSTYRFGAKKEFSIIARLDNWENENTTSGDTEDEMNLIYGVAWQQNKNVKWLATAQNYDTDDNTKDYTSAMITAEVHW